MVLTLTAQLDLLKKFVEAIAAPWDSDTTWYISLHTADPTSSGNQASSEATYGAYARVPIVRATDWDVVGQTLKNHSAINFPTSTGTTNTITHIGIGRSLSGTGYLIWYGPLPVSKVIASGDVPFLSAGDVVLGIA